MFKALSGPSHFEQVLFVHQEIAFGWIIHIVHSAQLIVEEGFPDGSNLRVAGTGYVRLMPKVYVASTTVYRIDYIDALKRLTQNGEPATIIRAMERVRLWSSSLDGSDYDALKAYLEKCNAFRNEQEYILKF